MRYQDAYQNAVEKLLAADAAEPEADAWVLFEHVTALSRTYYFLKKQDEIPEDEAARLQELVQKRMLHIPVQQLTGVQYFCGMEFFVNEHVLIPRQDTECLVEEALKHIKDQDRILDLCTGSGCILLSIGKLSGKKLGLVGSDISEQALKVAKENAKRLQVDADFLLGDLFENVEGEYDVIVSNPPYIPTEEIEKLTPEVKEHEPFGALDGKEDGLYFYRKIIKEAISHLKEGGWLLFEIGYDQGESVPLLMKEAGLYNISVIKDLAGLNRVVVCQRL